ncbi:hypothetical protein ACFQX6_18715 [Streptosporangium lutulentum]
MALLGLKAIGPLVEVVTEWAGDVVAWLVGHNLLPLASVLIEPAKVLFLNNAINHGVLGPLGVAEAVEHGKSILFMLESNPGPGLGLLLAFMFFGPRALRPSTPAAIIIHFLGGIHEIYFPYVLMKPRLILAVIAGGAAGILVFIATGAGLVATPSPGSIFAYLAVTPRGGWFGVIAASSPPRPPPSSSPPRFWASAGAKRPKPRRPARTATPVTPVTPARTPSNRKPHPSPRRPDHGQHRQQGHPQDHRGLRRGHGQQRDARRQLRKQLKGQQIQVEHTPVNSIPADADVVVCHAGLAARAKATAPDKVLISFQLFIGDPAVTKLVNTIKNGGTVDA